MLPETFPNFLIIGAGKSGTTSLYHYLSQHPEVYLPKTKETHYFLYDHLYNEGPEKYVSIHYKQAGKYSVRGDAPPSYFRDPDKIIPRIRETYGENIPKFIIILRNPVKRAWSHYLHRCRTGNEKEPFEKALELEAKRVASDPDNWWGYYSDGLYAKLLSKWFAHFPKENFLILTTDELEDNPETLMKKVYLFLNVDEEYVVQDNRRQNTARILKYKKLMAFINSPTLLKYIFKNIVPIHIRQKLKPMIIRFSSEPIKDNVIKISPQTEIDLKNKYRCEIERLEQMIDMDLPKWK